MKQMQEAVGGSEEQIQGQVKMIQVLEYEEEKALEDLKALKGSPKEEETKKNALQAEVDAMRAEVEKYRMELSGVNAVSFPLLFQFPGSWGLFGFHYGGKQWSCTLVMILVTLVETK